MPEITEAPVPLGHMTQGREEVEDYRSHGLTLRAHPLASLCKDLAEARSSRAQCCKKARCLATTPGDAP